MNKRNTGLTLIEIMISIAIIVILTAAYLIVANPAGQLSASRNNVRSENLQAIMLAIQQYRAEQGNETFSCASAGLVPTTSTIMASTGGYNIAQCLVTSNGSYGLFVMPFDPSASSSYYNSAVDYNTGYKIIQNASGSITLSAPNAELKQMISITR